MPARYNISSVLTQLLNRTGVADSMADSLASSRFRPIAALGRGFRNVNRWDAAANAGVDRLVRRVGDGLAGFFGITPAEFRENSPSFVGPPRGVGDPAPRSPASPSPADPGTAPDGDVDPQAPVRMGAPSGIYTPYTGPSDPGIRNTRGNQRSNVGVAGGRVVARGAAAQDMAGGMMEGSQQQRMMEELRRMRMRAAMLEK